MKINSFFNRRATGLFCLLFSFIFLSVWLNNAIFRYSPGVQGAVMLIFAAAVAASLAVYTRFRDFFISKRYFILAMTVIFFFLVQLTIGLNTIANPMYDHGKVFYAAVNWATGNTGREFAVYDEYLHHYPQQMGQFLVLRSVFKLCLFFGIDSFYVAACVVGHILFAVMIVCAFFYLERVCSSDCALFMLVLRAMFLPMYFQSSVSYTDTYSVWSIPCTLLLADLAVKSDRIRAKIMYSLLAGGLLAVGARIKVTVVIVAIALVIQYRLNAAKKQNLLRLARAVIAFVLVSAVFDKRSYATVLQHERDGEGMPVTHWIMMGLQTDGSYNWVDEWYITCAVAPDKRVEKNIQVIKERLNEMGAGGYRQLLYRKTCRTFGSGTGEMYYNYQYQDNSPVAGWVYEIVFQQGKYFSLFNNLSQGMYLFMMFLSVAGAVIVLKQNNPLSACFAPYLSLVGFWMFMMLWESNHRQLINQWSLFFICGRTGLYLIWQAVCKKINSRQHREQEEQKVRQGVGAAL